MNMDERLKAPSLAQHFNAPDGYRGFFGWMCGYSADASFLSDAIERFSGQTAAQRAAAGKLSIALLLEPSRPQILPKDVPGLAHFRMLDVDKRPFRLLHAKLALLAYQSTLDSDEWLLRLLVSTGNWTRGTLEESLDLAWRIDLPRSWLQSGESGESKSQTVADLRAAWDFLRWLKGLFDTRILTWAPPGRADTLTSLDHARFERIMSRLSRFDTGTAQPRFFDNREKSLVSQLPALVKQHTGNVRRNSLDMGSGFYEAPNKKGTLPKAPSTIVSQLKKDGLLTESSEINLFVNPQACQGVAESMKAIESEGWSVRAAYTNPNIYGRANNRSLHAKFILSANVREGSNICSSPWIYLGSGNLTAAGFLNPMSVQGGNLEAGVVFSMPDLYWWSGRSIPETCVIPNLLPIRWDDDPLPARSLAAGNTEPDPGIFLPTPPIPFLVWRPSAETGILLPPDTQSDEFTIQGPNDESIRADKRGAFAWPGSKPASVTVIWKPNSSKSEKGIVPVIDQFGSIASIPLQQIDVEQAVRELESFPSPSDDSEDVDDPYGEPGDPPAGANDGPKPGIIVTSDRYPIRSLMLLIERIAEQQTGISRSDWSAWCIRLEQTLAQMAKCKNLEQFRSLRINPLSALRQPAFRPKFADTATTNESILYDAALTRVEEIWQVQGFNSFMETSQ